MLRVMLRLKVRFQEAEEKVKHLTEVLSTYERQYGPVNYQAQGVHVPVYHDAIQWIIH